VVHCVYNKNCNLFLWIKIFICKTGLYNATADRWSCHQPNRNVCATQVLPMGVGRSVPLRSDIKGTELPLPTYWYRSKGNWLRYNSAADSFYIMKLCSRLFSEPELTFTFAICYHPSVVFNVHAPYSGGSNFPQYFYGIRYLGHPLTFTENFMEIVPGELNPKGVVKYSDFGYILETVQDSR